MLAKIEKIKYLSKNDQGTSAVLLVEFVRSVAEIWFRIRGEFVPSTKEFLGLFAEECPEFGRLFEDFHLYSTELNSKFIQAKRMLDIVYV